MLRKCVGAPPFEILCEGHLLDQCTVRHVPIVNSNTARKHDPSCTRFRYRIKQPLGAGNGRSERLIFIGSDGGSEVKHDLNSVEHGPEERGPS
jgi:hypothetical protein